MKLFKYTLLGLLSAVALATVAKEQLVTLLRNGEVVATFKSSDIWTFALWYNNSIYPVNEKGEASYSIHSWNKEMNTAIFAIEPKELLDEYTPTYELSEDLEPYAHNGKVMEVDKANGLVYVYFSTPRKTGKRSVTVTLGEGDEAEKGVLQVISYPEIQSVTFYGPTAGEEIASRPYLDQRPGLGLERQYWALECEKTISLNQEDEIRVAVNVAGGEMEDILEAIKCCKWRLASTGNPIEDTNKLKILENSYEIVEGHGFDAILKVSSVGMGDEELVFGPCLNEMGTYDHLYLTYHVKGKMHAVDVNGKEIEYKHSWNLNTDRALFACDRALLEKYTPTYRVEGYIEITNMWVNKDEELIYVEFSSPRKAGHGDIIVSIGEGAEAQEAKLTVYMYPTFSFVSFYGETAGPDISSMPYLYYRPVLGTLTMYMATKCEKIIDINSEDEVRVAMNIYGGDDDIREATKCYEWKQVSGDALVVTRDDSEIVPYNGFDAIIGVRSGMKTGKVVFECKTPCFTEEDPDNPVTLTLTYNVVNIKKDYPIREIILDNDNVTLDMNQTHIVKMTVEPMASYAYQKVKVEAADPTIVKLLDFEGYDLPIQGLKPGTTTVKFTAYNDTQIVEKTMTVTVNDPVGSVVIANSGDTYIFAGGTTTWKANAYSMSGALMEDVPLTWSSSNGSVAIVDNNGVITGVASGSANITAASGEIKSGIRAIRVVAAPEAISEAYGFQGFWDEGDDIVFLDNSDGSLYITGGFANGLFEGSYTLDGAYYMNMDGAKAPATGTVTISKGTGTNQYIVTMNVSINLSSTKSVSFKFSNGIIEYFPE